MSVVKASDLLYKSLIAISSLSLGINAYLVKERVSEMTESVKELNDRMWAMQIEQAVTRNRVDNNLVRVEIIESILSRRKN